MAQFLDKAGVTYLWGKIKDWVSNYAKIVNGKITIGSQEITPLTSHQDISGKQDVIDSSHKLSADLISDGTTNKAYTATEKTKLSGIATGAEVNQNAFSNVKVGSSTIAADGKTDTLELAVATNSVASLTADTTNDKVTIDVDKDLSKYDNTTSGFLTSFTESDPTVPSWAKASSKPTYTASEVGAVATTAVGAASGVCPLNSSSKIDSTYLPSYVDDVIEAYARSGQTALTSTWLATESASGTVITPESGKVYILMADSGNYAANSQFRWGGTAYVQLYDGGVSAITTSEIDAIVAS